ncbi:MAG: hypothetical protein ASARMPREDX12_001698 [Alectoria sarmentosa]|nr:MAG: hypothetical protein ASARMPREDX12_001698 [Alectoria sarmentosa]
MVRQQHLSLSIASVARTTGERYLFHDKRNDSTDTEWNDTGPVFRVSPNELSFASAVSWKDIYGQKKPGQAQLRKSDFYDIYGSGFTTACIGSERNPQVHARKKKNLTAAFSTRALAEQEGLVQGVVDVFVRKIGGAGLGEKEGGVNLTEWFEMVAFDVLGEMAFGEGFGCVENEEPHFWIELILKHLLAVTLVDNLRRWPLMATIGRFLLPKATVSVRDKHSNFSRTQVKHRLESQSPRRDFLTNIVGFVKSGEVSQEEMTAHSSTLIIAGGETTATFLAAVTFYLLDSPKSYRKLQAEVREKYSCMEEITAGSALQLPFLQAVIHEGLRMYPPGSQGFPRISPGAMIDGYWVPLGASNLHFCS